MVRSYSNTLQSVRRVTQQNHGKHTPGVDKVVVNTPTARMRLVTHLHHAQLWRANPVRRVFIPKKNGKLRPLGIATIADRVYASTCQKRPGAAMGSALRAAQLRVPTWAECS